MLQRLLPYTPDRDIYRLLGVPASASSEEIVAACRRLARTFHPDRNASQRATEEMQVVNVVRQVMTDPQWRAIYDRERQQFHRASDRVVRVRPTPSADAAAREPATAATPLPPSPWGRYLRAVAVGARAMLGGLAPSRCRGCRIVIEPGDAYCAACGTPLLTGG
jgi:curved DNA-binding protein CbpA